MAEDWQTFTKRSGERISYLVKERLVSVRTRYQKLDIVDTVPHGPALFLDDKIQSAANDEWIYHEIIVHPALLAHPRPRRLFIAGGGEGAALREVLRHPSVEEVVMVDIDAEAVAAVRQHLRVIHQGSFDDPRVRLIHADARAYLRDHPQLFDSIIVDVTDPLAGGPSSLLFTREFYELAAQRLGEQGTIAVQAESVDVGVHQTHVAVVATLAHVFPNARGYAAHVPSFGESWGFAAAGLRRGPADLSPEEVDRELAARGLTAMRFYDGATHRAIFTRPRWLREEIAATRWLITDANPFHVA